MKTMRIRFTLCEDNCDIHLDIEVQMWYKMEKTAPIPRDSKSDF